MGGAASLFEQVVSNSIGGPLLGSVYRQAGKFVSGAANAGDLPGPVGMPAPPKKAEAEKGELPDEVKAMSQARGRASTILGNTGSAVRASRILGGS